MCLQDVKSRSYQRMREHLQLRLKEKHSHSHGSISSQDSSTSSGKISGASALNGTEGIDDLVEYINGSQAGRTPPSNPKKAAKKARQKQRKVATFIPFTLCECIIKLFMKFSWKKNWLLKLKLLD